MKTVLITGGAKRLGRALVEHYAAKEWRVLFTTRYSFEEGVALAQSLGSNVHCIRSGVSDRPSAGMLAKWVEQKSPRLDLLICNASTFKRIPAVDTLTGDIKDLLESNFIGPFFLAQQCQPLLKSAYGSIVNIADAQVDSGLPNFSAYLAAKAATVSMTKSLAMEWAPHVRVNAVLPGSLPWPEDGTYTQQEVDKMTAQIPLNRIGEWRDIVMAVDYLESATYVTGHLLNVDGGRTAVY